MSGYTIKDSGQRVTTITGAQRDAVPGKGFFHLIPYLPHERLAKHYEAGARKYSRNNWQKGMPLSWFLDSAARHLGKLNENWPDEDHASAVSWNMYGYIWTKNEIEEGRLPAELDDVGHCNIINNLKETSIEVEIKNFEEYTKGIEQLASKLGDSHGC